MDEVNNKEYVPTVTITQEEYRELLLAKVINNMIKNMHLKKEYLSDSFLATIFGLEEEED